MHKKDKHSREEWYGKEGGKLDQNGQKGGVKIVSNDTSLTSISFSIKN